MNRKICGFCVHEGIGKTTATHECNDSDIHDLGEAQPYYRCSSHKCSECEEIKPEKESK